jgi:Domain of unknown function (DUF1963)
MSIEDQTRSSVRFITEQEDRLARRAPPIEFSNPQHRFDAKAFVFRPRRLRPRLWLLPPPVCSRELLGIGDRAPPHDRSGIYPKHWEQATKESYEQFWRDLAVKHPNAFGPPPAGNMIHQVGDIPFSIGDPVEVDCVKFAEDDYNSQPQVKAWFERARKDGPPIHWPDFEQQNRAFGSFEDRQRVTHYDRANRWQLVLQIDSDFEAGMQWGDASRIYVCIRKQDLAESRFDCCWTILQCT